MGYEGPAVEADSTWYSERCVVRPTGIVADLNRSRHPGRSHAPGRLRPRAIG